LLIDALMRSANHAEEIGVFGVVVDAKHERAKQFYRRYGFVELSQSPLTLILPIKTIQKSTLKNGSDAICA